MIELDLLWRAWPQGVLSQCDRGLSTVGGYLYWGNGHWITNPGVQGTDGHAKATMWGICDPATCAPLLNGHLLPAVDPTNVATWACPLRDFARAVGAPKNARNVTWRRNSQRMWVLGWDGLSPSALFIYALDTDDAAQALVLARIQVREMLDTARISK